MTQSLRAFSYGHGGLGVVLFAVIAGFALPHVAGFSRRADALLPWLWRIIWASILAEFVLTTWYLVCPAYLDHIEASVASTVHSFLAGAPLYPSLESYTFNGLLYGPLLAEINSLGYVLFQDSFAAKIVGWLAGWISVAVLIGQIRKGDRGTAGLAALTYGLSFLFSFGADVIVARPEPLLMLFTAASLTVALRAEGPQGPVLLGLLCGAAMGLKAHAPLYLLPSVYLWASLHAPARRDRRWITLTTCFCAAAAIALVLPFVPKNVSASDYLRFLTLATRHGLSLDLFGRNVAFVAGVWAPLLLLAGSFLQVMRTSQRLRGFALTLLGAECVVLIVASKPGAGIHHFLPFLAPHALLFKELYVQQTAPGVTGRAALAATVAALGMITPTAQTYGQLLAFDLRLPEQGRERDELLELAMRFPRGMIGVADNRSYDLANFRPWLTARGVPQTDYGAFMDLKLSGVTDGALTSGFARCAIPFVYVPRPGTPFSLVSFYGEQPLFSDELRREFADRYSLLDAGVYFDVFACHPARAAAR